VTCGASVAGAKSRAAGNRLGEVDDDAPLIACLCGPEALWITAQALRVNAVILTGALLTSDHYP
jgi:hypothetical protein